MLNQHQLVDEKFIDIDIDSENENKNYLEEKNKSQTLKKSLSLPIASSSVKLKRKKFQFNLLNKQQRQQQLESTPPPPNDLLNKLKFSLDNEYEDESEDDNVFNSTKILSHVTSTPIKPQLEDYFLTKKHDHSLIDGLLGQIYDRYNNHSFTKGDSNSLNSTSSYFISDCDFTQTEFFEHERKKLISNLKNKSKNLNNQTLSNETKV